MFNRKICKIQFEAPQLHNVFLTVYEFSEMYKLWFWLIWICDAFDFHIL